jgi:TPR repeat protein
MDDSRSLKINCREFAMNHKKARNFGVDWDNINKDGDRLWRLGAEYEDLGDIDRAVKAYTKASLLGDPSAQSNLANILDDKLNRPKEAVYWYKKAINSGYSVAALNLAIHYKNLKSRRWYIYWLNVAAKMGDEQAVADLRELAERN